MTQEQIREKLLSCQNKNVMKLQSLPDYVSMIEVEINKYSTRNARTREYFDRIIEYNHFLQTPLTLEMFTSGKYFKDIRIQDSQPFIKFYGGIRVYNYNWEVPIDKCFSEVFVNGSPRFNKTIGDLVNYDIELMDTQ